MQNLSIDALLDRVREVHGLKSDYAIHKAYGISAQKIANWRHGRNLPDEKSCQVLAEAALLDPDVVIAQVHAMRAQDAGARAIWNRIAERLSLAAHGSVAAVFAAAVAIGLIAADVGPASAAEPSPLDSSASSSIHRI